MAEMNTRLMQKIGTEPDKTFLDRVTQAYQSLVSPAAAAR